MSRQFTVNEVARWFNLPASRIGGTRASGTYANLEQDQLAFVTHSIRPVCRMFEGEFNRKLLSPDERATVACKFSLADMLENLGAMSGKGLPAAGQEAYTNQEEKGAVDA
jgi:phage portal protein BeeE